MPRFAGVNKSGIKPGTIVPCGTASVPGGFLYCNGASLLRSAYPELFAAIGTAWGSADSLHFNLPDMRGRALRGRNNGSGNDPDAASRTASNTGGATGDAVGTVQTDQIVSHAHNVQGSNFTGGGTSLFQSSDASTHDRNHSTDAAGGSETRMKNAGVDYMIAFA